MLVDDLPVLEGTSCSQMVTDNLNALYWAGKVFIQQETSEKICRAFRHQIRRSGDLKFVCSDTVCYKRNGSSKWKGQGTVLGQKEQQILIKHDRVYVRLHPRLVLHKASPQICQDSEEESRKVQKSETEHVAKNAKCR